MRLIAGVGCEGAGQRGSAGALVDGRARRGAAGEAGEQCGPHDRVDVERKHAHALRWTRLLGGVQSPRSVAWAPRSRPADITLSAGRPEDAAARAGATAHFFVGTAVDSARGETSMRYGRSMPVFNGAPHYT
ncbi:MAG: hypothetical protein KIT60_28340 [Burkholderiaceae bacterium]|nr:hypothetical protein [Burkholderiaceae bacterium]